MKVLTLSMSLSLGMMCLPALASAQEPGAIVRGDCEAVHIDEARFDDEGRWYYRYAGKCNIRYYPHVKPKTKKTPPGLVGPEPGDASLAKGWLLVTGVGSYDPKTRMAADAFEIEGQINGRNGHSSVYIDTKGSGTFKCISDPFLEHEGITCVNKGAPVAKENAPWFALAMSQRPVPMGNSGITPEKRSAIAKEGKPGPPPPPPPPKKPKKGLGERIGDNEDKGTVKKPRKKTLGERIGDNDEKRKPKRRRKKKGKEERRDPPPKRDEKTRGG